jgi:hypothetical protein
LNRSKRSDGEPPKAAGSRCDGRSRLYNHRPTLGLASEDSSSVGRPRTHNPNLSRRPTLSLLGNPFGSGTETRPSPTGAVKLWESPGRAGGLLMS